MKKTSCWVNNQWVNYPKPDSHIRDKVKVLLDLTNYPTKKDNSMADIDNSYLAAKKILLL